MTSVGIIGIGTFLPPEIRRNDWWPPDVVARWQAPREPPPPPSEITDGIARVMAAMREQAADPFQGVVERRVMAADMTATDMELHAAEQAIASAGVARGDIDLLLAHTAVPEYLMANPACALHDRLGLAAECMTFQLDAHGYSFLAQLNVAREMIATGRVRYALLVQSCAPSRVLDAGEPHSTLLGDAASAVVVGPVATGGILAAYHRTDGRYPRALVATVPGGRWYDDGRIVLHRADPAGARQVFLETADNGRLVVGEALRRAGVTPSDVDFFAAHQGTPWLRRVAQDAIGLTNARHVDVFPTSGYLFSVSIPLVLSTGHLRGTLRAGDLVVLFGGGVGATFGATVMRWGGLAS